MNWRRQKISGRLQNRSHTLDPLVYEFVRITWAFLIFPTFHHYNYERNDYDLLIEAWNRLQITYLVKSILAKLVLVKIFQRNSFLFHLNWFFVWSNSSFWKQSLKTFFTPLEKWTMNLFFSFLPLFVTQTHTHHPRFPPTNIPTCSTAVSFRLHSFLFIGC